MPAYMVERFVECSEQNCTRLATHEVRNPRNELIRACCVKHAKALVDKLNEHHEAMRSTEPRRW